METVSANYLKSAYDAALALGAKEDDLLDAIGREVHRLSRPLARIPNAVFIKLLNVAAKSAKLDGLGVYVGAGFRPSTFLDIGYALTFCKSIRQVIEINGKYQPLTQRLGKTSLKSQGGATQIVWTPGNETVAKERDRKSTRLNSSHDQSSYAVLCLKKKRKKKKKKQVKSVSYSE